jgi:hypothetical protein
VASQLNSFVNPLFTGNVENFTLVGNFSKLVLSFNIPSLSAEEWHFFDSNYLVILTPECNGITSSNLRKRLETSNGYSFGLIKFDSKEWRKRIERPDLPMKVTILLPKNSWEKWAQVTQLTMLPVETCTPAHIIYRGCEPNAIGASRHLMQSILSPQRSIYANLAELREVKESMKYAKKPWFLSGIHLNDSQFYAVKNAHESQTQAVFLLDGPPGTGTIVWQDYPKMELTLNPHSYLLISIHSIQGRRRLLCHLSCTF